SLMANTRRSKLKPWKTKPIPVTSDPQFTPTQGSSPTLTPNNPCTSTRSTGIAMGKLERLKTLLPFSRSNQTVASASMNPHDLQRESTQIVQANESPEPTGTVDQAVAPVTCVCDEIDAAKTEHDGVVSPSRATLSQIDTINSTFIELLRDFNTVVSAIANVHPYAQIVLGLLSCAAKVIIAQTKLDDSVSNLLSKIASVYRFLLEPDTKANLNAMKDTLTHIAQVVSSCAQFIENYAETKSFWKQATKDIFSETQSVIDEYTKALDELMQEFRDRAVRDTYISIHHVLDVLEDLNLDGMEYAKGAGPDTRKKCLDGMRVEILKEIVDWINDPDVNVLRIFWLHGQAGSGKSAIAHTIALQYKNSGGLCSCFCFARDRTPERQEEKMLSTIVQDLANRDPAFRQALWEKLLKPLRKGSDGRVGSVVVVINALDESRPNASQKYILKVLTEAASLPSNFCILLTLRPLADIMFALRDTQHVKGVSLDKVPAESDIHLYVSEQLKGGRGIGAVEISQIVCRADGLFEWAWLACEWIRPGIAGETIKERFDDLMKRTLREGKILLDKMYIAVLERAVGRRQKSLAHFHSSMRQILYTLKPLPMDALHAMRMHFPHGDDCFDVALILDYMGSLLSGVTDRKNPVRLLHSSFHDFLTDDSQSVGYSGRPSCCIPLCPSW
ncbi:hypothetical protein SCLCIDRAFT_1224567, partial [Scleroderma citrinum Foug A]